jgi:rRNA processing protein Gar1
MATTTKHARTRRTRIKYGDKVAVPWGLGEIVGEVEEVYGPRTRKYVVVRIPTRGPLGEILHEENMSFPADTLRLVAAA